MRDRIVPDKAKPAEHNGDIWSRASTQYGAILAAKIVLFLLKVSITVQITNEPGESAR